MPGYARYFTPPPFELVAPPTLGAAGQYHRRAGRHRRQAREGRASHLFRYRREPNRAARPERIGVDAYYKIARIWSMKASSRPVILTPFNYRQGLAEAWLTHSYDVENMVAHSNFSVSKAMGQNIISGQFNFAPDELSYIANHFIHLDHDQTYSASAGSRTRSHGPGPGWPRASFSAAACGPAPTRCRTAPRCPTTNRSI